MSTSRIQCAVEFLTLIVLAACALANSQDECPCKCPKVDADNDLCEIIKVLKDKVESYKPIEDYSTTLQQSKKFFENIESPISDIVNKLVKSHINGVLEKAVTDLGIPSGNPGDSTEEPIEEDGLEGTGEYLIHMFKVMKNWNLEVKEKLKRVEKLYSRLQVLEDDINMYKDLKDIKKTLRDLSSEMNGTKLSDNRTVQIGECIDEKYPTYCEQIVEAKFCATEYYSKVCCASCTKAGQLPRHSTSET